MGSPSSLLTKNWGTYLIKLPTVSRKSFLLAYIYHQLTWVNQQKHYLFPSPKSRWYYWYYWGISHGSQADHWKKKSPGSSWWNKPLSQPQEVHLDLESFTWVIRWPPTDQLDFKSFQDFQASNRNNIFLWCSTSSNSNGQEDGLMFFHMLHFEDPQIDSFHCIFVCPNLLLTPCTQNVCLDNIYKH